MEVAAAVNLPQKGVKVEGTLFLPQNTSRVRAVIVLLNSGYSWEGMGGAFYHDPELRKLAGTLECGLLLPRITDIVQGDAPSGIFLRNAGLGGSDGLVLLLDRLAQESGHRELTGAPLLLWAHSRAGHFAARLAALYPRRTVAIVGYHMGGAGFTGHDKDILSNIPALILMARADIEANANRPGWPWPPAETVWRNGRSIGARWTFGVEPDAVHQNPADLKKANDLVIPWIAAVLRQRLSPGNGELRVLSDASAFLGNIQTGEIAPFSVFPGSKREATWLPDEQSARGWRVVVGATK